ncbi:minor tail protein [Arthrobacter phage Wildwest]|uniref:Minor tail protein n=1 Tax=Arthrobacter phage Wildwest TaxID=3051767 RepID=A0AA96HU00_9CAUD|nr:minor tail protein [Arthrobacter phage Wildwest]
MALETFATTAASLTLTTGEMLELQPGTNQVLTLLDGWFSPAGTRREGTSRLWAHGSFSERGWRDQRVITVGGHIFTETRAEAAAMTDTLAAALADGTAGKFIVDDADLGYREASVYITGNPDVKWNGGLDIFFMIDMVAPDPRKYGEPVNVGTPAAAPGGGLALPLFAPQLGTKLRTNYASQPSVEYASTNWTPYGSNTTGAVMTNGGKYGPNYYRLTYSASSTGNRGRYHDEPVAVTSGETWTASMWVRPSTTLTLKMNMEFRTAADVLVGSTVQGTAVSCPANVWTRLSVSGAATGNADVIRVQNYAFTATFPAGATYDLDAEQIERGTLTDYMDGDTTASDKAYQWTGTAGNSASNEYSLADSGGVLDFGPAGAPGTVTLENAGTADSAPVFTVSGYAPGFTITEVSTGARLIYTGTVLAGQTLVINAADGSVLLDGYADRSAFLSRREWTRVPGRGRNTYLFESPGNDGASLTLGVKPAWW